MCPCGYYSSCLHACSSAQIKALVAQRERAWEDEELQAEYVKDRKEDVSSDYR